MTPEAFQSAQTIAEEIRQQFYRAIGPKRRARLREALGRLKSIGGGAEIMPYVRVQIGVLNRRHQKVVVFGGIDASYCDDHELFIMAPEPTPRTYFVDEELVMVPDDQCPKCLGEWKINLHNLRPCPECGAEFGTGVKVVVVDETCPLCDEKLPLLPNEVCNCGFDRRAAYVAWRT